MWHPRHPSGQCLIKDIVRILTSCVFYMCVSVKACGKNTLLYSRDCERYVHHSHSQEVETAKMTSVCYLLCLREHFLKGTIEGASTELPEKNMFKQYPQTPF